MTKPRGVGTKFVLEFQRYSFSLFGVILTLRKFTIVPAKVIGFAFHDHSQWHKNACWCFPCDFLPFENSSSSWWLDLLFFKLADPCRRKNCMIFQILGWEMFPFGFVNHVFFLFLFFFCKFFISIFVRV